MGAGARSAVRAGGTLAAAAGGPAGLAVGAVALLGTAALAATKKIKDFADATLESQRELARFEGKIASVFARLDRQEAILAARTAAGTSGSTQLLGEQMMALRDEWQPMREDLATLKNLMGAVATAGLRATNFIIQWHPVVIGLRKVIEAAERWLGGGAPEAAPWMQAFFNPKPEDWLKENPRPDHPGYERDREQGSGMH